MNKTEKRALGDLGEELTVRKLTEAGHKVVERNYWRPWGEIDIISERGSILHFIEVKSVSREAPFTEKGIRPEENMHEGKLKRLHRVVQTYLLEKKVPDSRHWQIDLACVFIDRSAKKAKVEIMENIVL